MNITLFGQLPNVNQIFLKSLLVLASHKPYVGLWKYDIIFKILLLTAPKAIERKVCIFGGVDSSGRVARTAFLATSWFPVRVQNLMCCIPTVTKLLSESGRNSAWNIRREWPVELAILEPMIEPCYNIISN